MKAKAIKTLIAIAFVAAFYGLAAIAQAGEDGTLSFIGCIGLLAVVALLMKPVIRKVNEIVK